MNKLNYNFKKKYGQNFITDNNIISKISSYIDLDDNDLVIEIGPGAGILTNELSKVTRVLAYEIDGELKPILNKVINHSKVTIIWDDFLSRSISDDLSNYNYNKLYVVANLPYYITTPIIEKLINENVDITKIIIMVQKEVGERFSALPGSRDYGSLTVFLNYYYDIKKLFVVSRKVFNPQPNVDSMVVCFEKKTNSIIANDKNVFFKLVRDSFKYKRKTLKNNLLGYNLENVEKVLTKHKMNLTIRAEEIPLEVFIEIANNL